MHTWDGQHTDDGVGTAGVGVCNQILPCTDNTCKVYCQKLGYRFSKAQCKPGNLKKGVSYDNCCCLKLEPVIHG